MPATSFCEYDGRHARRPTWFALGPDRPPFAFAGLWRPWTGTRRGEAGAHMLFAFLTTEANAIVRPVHAKAMPVMLAEEAWDTWLDAEVPAVPGLQRPFPADRMMVVATGERRDPPIQAAPIVLL